MSETQLKVTDKLQAKDEAGNEYTVYEYTVFGHTTTMDMSIGTSDEKAYKLANGSALTKISDSVFEIGLDGTRIHIVHE